MQGHTLVAPFDYFFYYIYIFYYIGFKVLTFSFGGAQDFDVIYVSLIFIL